MAGTNRREIFRRRRNLYARMTNAIRNVNAQSTNQYKNLVRIQFVIRVRNNFPDLREVGNIKSWEKLYKAYAAVRNERKTRVLNTNLSPSRFALAKSNKGNTRVLINPGNRNGSARVSYENIKKNIEKYKRGNRAALNKWMLNNLVRVNWNMAGERPYTFKNGVWYRAENTVRPLTKNMILENINLNMTYR